MSDSAQFGLDLGSDSDPVDSGYDLDEIREDAAIILDAARAVTADSLWSGQTHRYNKIVFAQMCDWLPSDEGQQLSLAFDEEIQRIEMLMAA